MEEFDKNKAMEIIAKYSVVAKPPKDNVAEKNQAGSIDLAKIVRKNIEESKKNPPVRKSRKIKNLTKIFGSL